METPGEYGSLEEYFRHYRSPQMPVSPRTFSDPGLLRPDDLPDMTVSKTILNFIVGPHTCTCGDLIMLTVCLIEKRGEEI